MGQFLEDYQLELTHTGEMTPDAVPALGADAFAAALKFGVTAHALAVAAETVPVFKHLGLPQLAAGLVDAAAFGPIINNTIGRDINVGLGRAKEYEARERWRTVWASPRDYEAAWLKRQVTTEAYRRRLQYEGWREFEIDAWLGPDGDAENAVPWREPNPRELGILFEDVSIDEAWVLKMLRRQGYSDASSEQILKGVKLRSQKSLRAGLLSELNGAFEEGLLGTSELSARLEAMGLRQEAIQLIVDRSNQGKARRQAKRLLSSYQTLVVGNAIDIDTFKVSMSGLGYEADEVTVEAAYQQSKLDVAVLKAEKADTAAQLRKRQELTVRLYTDMVQRGQATPDQLEGALLQLGVEEDQAAAWRQIAETRQKPVLKLPTASTQEATDQVVQQTVAKEIERRVQDGTYDAGLAVAYLMGIGYSGAEAEARIRLALARGYTAPVANPPAKEDASVRAARNNRTKALLARYRAGEIGESALKSELIANGVADGEATSLVEAEKATAALAASRAAEQQATRDAAAVKAALKAYVVQEVKAGRADPAAALQVLEAAGFGEQEASLLVAKAAAATKAPATPAGSSS
jgi:hypothetical protein